MFIGPPNPPPPSNNGLKWVKEIETNQITQEEKEDSWMGGKDILCQLWAHQHRQELQVQVYIEHS